MDRKSLAKKLLCPPLWIILLLTAGSAAGLATVFVNGRSTAPAAYVCYVVAFYTLCILCVFCWKTLPGYWKTGKERNTVKEF